MNPSIKIPIPSFLIALILALAGIISLVPKTRAACDSPDPGCPGGNLAEGYLSLGSLTTGVYNTGIGVYSLLSITDGSLCTGIGAGALFSNSAGENTATGAGALFSNTTGEANTANGAFALFTNTNGNGNTAVGFSALHNNDTGLGKTAIGAFAGSSLTGNVNICIGEGVSGVSGEDNTIRIGDNLSDTQGDSACYIGGIYNQLGDPGTLTLLGIDADGKLATGASSRRFKRDIKPIAEASEAILRL